MKKKKEKTYTITLNHTQLRVLEEALDLHSRLSIGQVEIVTEFLSNHFFDAFKEKGITHWEIKQQYIDPLKEKLFGFGQGASYGVGHDKNPEVGRISYEMCKKCQNTIAKEDNHKTYSVWHHEPLKLSKEPLITIEEKEIEKPTNKGT